MPIISNFPSGTGGGGGGLVLAAVTDIQTLHAAGKVYVKWTDPEDLVVAGSTLAAWGGTLLVRKAGSAPVSRRDGVTVLDSKTRNAYKNSYFCDSGLTDGVTYYYKFFPYTTSGGYTDSSADEFNVTPNAIPMGNVSGMSAVAAGNGKLAIKYTDPAATVVQDGITLATWEKTVVVVKAGDYATDPDDAAAAFRQVVTTRNQYSSNPLVATGLTNGTTYYVSFFPISTDGAVNTATANRVTGIPNRLEITTAPSQSNTLTYNNTDQSPTWNGYVTTQMTLTGGATSGRNADTYTAEFTPTDDYCWAAALVVSGMANNRSPKPITWKINKATGTVGTDPATIPEINKNNLTTDFTITGDFDGTYNVTSSDTSVIAVSHQGGKTYRLSNVSQATGTATITITPVGGSNYTTPAAITRTAKAKFVTIYGVEWDGTSATTLSRTDASAGFTNPVPAVNTGSGSSPFDSLMPWSGMEKITDSEAGVLVKIPKFWYKFTKTGNKLKLQIADGQVDGFYVSPAHADRGDGKGERDFVYVGRYHCHTSNYKSQTGGKPKVSITRSAARTAIHNLGTTIWQFDLAMRQTIQMLYLVEFANWDSQSTIGGGCSETTANSSAVFNMGKTDSMTYHTGNVSGSHTAYGACQYRWIEGLWDNCYDWMDGCYYNSNGLNIILNPNNFSDTANGTLVGMPSSGYPTVMDAAVAGGVQWMYPTTANGSNTTYIPDYWSFSASGPCLHCGGSYSRNLSLGLFYVDYGTATYAVANIGCRLQKLP